MNRLCPVCRQQPLADFQTVQSITYYRCPECHATVMASDHHLDATEERQVYDLHDNDPNDSGYQQFLRRLVNPLLSEVRDSLAGSDTLQGLDFGCGPGPALAGLLEASGVNMSLYDPFYQPDTSVLDRTFDLVTCTEVVEHLYQPHDVFCQLDRLLKPGGWLGVMTCFQTSDDKFANWHYRRDPTHVVFYRRETMAWLARQFGWHLKIPAKDIALFRKSPEPHH